MKTKLGVIFMILGSVLVVAALSLFLNNLQEQKQAAEAVRAVMPQLVEEIRERQEAKPDDRPAVPEYSEVLVPNLTQKTMPVVEIDGHEYVGFVRIPALELELPVMADWSYSKLRISPCRFSGDMYSDDLVIMAHNYIQQFGGLSDLRVGDAVIFADMDGVSREYVVTALDVLESTAVEEMTAGVYDLTLFTCTYSGQSRVTVRCDQVEK